MRITITEYHVNSSYNRPPHTSLFSSPSSFQLLQEIQSIQNHAFTRFFHLSREKYLVQNGVDFVKVEDEILASRRASVHTAQAR